MRVVFLDAKEIASILSISPESARNEMRKMPHKCLGKNGQMLRVAETDFYAYMKPDPPLPRPEPRKKRTTETRSDRTIPYRPYRTQEATENV